MNQPYYLVREPSSVVINFGIVPETIKDSFIRKHINITPFVNLLRCEGLSCLQEEEHNFNSPHIHIQKERKQRRKARDLKEKLNDTLDLSTDRTFPDAVDKLKTLGVVGEFDGRCRLEAGGSRNRGGGPGRSRRWCSGSIDA